MPWRTIVSLWGDALHIWPSIFLASPLGLDHEWALPSYPEVQRQHWFLGRQQKDRVSHYKSSHRWEPSYPPVLENPLCRTCCTPFLTHWDEDPTGLDCKQRLRVLSLMGSWFPGFTEAWKMLTNRTRYSHSCLSPPFQQSLLHSVCNVVYKEKDLRWSLPEVQQTQIWSSGRCPYPLQRWVEWHDLYGPFQLKQLFDSMT